MNRNFQLRRVFSNLVAVLSVLLLAFNSKDDHFVELKQLANARSEAKFTSADDNFITELQKGTRGKIIENVLFKRSGNYGLRIKVLGGNHDGQFYWVYYNVLKDNMKFFTQLPGEQAIQETTNLSQAKATELKQNEKAISAKSSSESTKLDSETYAVPSTEDLLDSPKKDMPIESSKDENLFETAAVPQGVAIEESAELSRNIPEKLADVNERVSQLSPSNQDKTCSDCELKKPKSCTAQNSYIEEDLIDLQLHGSEFLQSLTTPIFPEQEPEGIDLRCVRASLESFPPKRFRKCVPSDDSPNRLKDQRAHKPCVTDRLASTLTKSFNITAKCLQPILGSKGDYKFKLQKIFEMISIESGFHTNVVGSNSDVGIGQLQGSAVAGINRIIIDEAKSSLRRSDDKECNNLYTEFLKDNEPIKPNNICNRMAPSKGNPWKNMIYTFLYFKVNRDLLDDMIFNQYPYKNSVQMPSRELEKLKDEMAKLAHNRGAAGAADILGPNLIRNFNSQFPARTAREALNSISKNQLTYLTKSAARAASVEKRASLAREESCIRGY